MRRAIAILGLLAGLGVLLFFLSPSVEEVEMPEEELEEIKPETVATLNPLLTFALQGGEEQVWQSWNKASTGLFKKVKNVMVKLKLQKESEKFLGAGVVIRGGKVVLTACKNLEKAKDIEIVLSDGTSMLAEFVGREGKSGVTLLKTVNPQEVIFSEIEEGMKGGEVLVLVEWDEALGDIKMNFSSVSARPSDKSLVFSNPNKSQEVFLFNTQGKLIGVRGRVEVKGRDDYLMLAGGRLSQWVESALVPAPAEASALP